MQALLPKCLPKRHPTPFHLPSKPLQSPLTTKPPARLTPTPTPLSLPPPKELNMFKALFTPISHPNHPSAKLQHKRYQLRWDWHLRMFLNALVTPLGCWIFCLWVGWIHQDDIAKYEMEARAKEKEEEEKFSKPIECFSQLINKKLEDFKMQLNVLAERVEEQEQKQQLTLEEMEVLKQKSGGEMEKDVGDSGSGSRSAKEAESENRR